MTHELIHAERGHTAACSPREEASVRAETARRLIPIGRLLDALAWAHSWDEAANALWVTVEVFTDRLKNLTDDERALIDDLATRVDRGA